VLNDGESLLAAVPPHHRALFEQLAEASPDNSVMLPFSIWREAFINDADLDVARASYEQLSPGPYQQMTEPLAISTAPRTSRSRRANGVGIPGLQEARAVPAGPMPGSHEVIFTDPNGLADKIIEAGRD
jgi:hypothetical protein